MWTKVLIFIVGCVLMFFLIFIKHEMFWEIVPNNITDYNDPNFTGGFTYEFRLLKYFT